MSTPQSSKLWYANGDCVDCTIPRAPELFEVPSNCTITAKTDVWSLGCSLYAAAFGVFLLSFPLSTLHHSLIVTPPPHRSKSM